MRVIDSHLHLWDPEELTYTWLSGAMNYRFADTELEHARLEQAAPERSVFVQAETAEEDFLAEVRWVAQMAPRLGIVGIVAGARLDRGAETTAHLDALSREPLVIGVRHSLQDEPEALATSARFLDGARELIARGWSFDACVRAPQLPAIVRLARALPELTIVLDHLGKPEVGSAQSPVAPSASWRQDLAALARYPNVFGKLSGLPAEAGGDWDAAQLEPFLDAAAEAFGADRLMWGSDWPVSVIGPAEPGDPYAPEDGSPAYQYSARARWADTVMSWARTRGYSQDEIFWSTAARVYRTEEPRLPEPERQGLIGWLRGRRR